jgi:hypothetical protein
MPRDRERPWAVWQWRASSICNAHYFTSISSRLVLDLPYRFLCCLYPLSTLRRPTSISRQAPLCGSRPHDCLSRPINISAIQHNSCSRACSSSRFSNALLGSQLKSLCYVVQITSHGSLVGEIPALDSTTTQANHTHLQSPGNAACLARSEEGRRTGP